MISLAFNLSLLGTYDVCIYDFDGTLVDSIPQKNKAFEKATARLLPMTDTIVRYIKGSVHLPRVDRLRGILSLAGVFDSRMYFRLKEYLEQEMVGIYDRAPICWSLVEYIRKAEGQTAFIISAAPEVEVRNWITKLHLEHLFSYIYGFPSSKSESLRETLKDYQEHDCSIIYMGDTHYDLELSEVNNIDFMWSAYG